jgi:hypothetical protein
MLPADIAAGFSQSVTYSLVFPSEMADSAQSTEAFDVPILKVSLLPDIKSFGKVLASVSIIFVL